MDVGKPCEKCGWKGDGWKYVMMIPMLGYYLYVYACPECGEEMHINTRDKIGANVDTLVY